MVTSLNERQKQFALKFFESAYEVNLESGCWEWRKNKHAGYGLYNGHLAHRVSYIIHKGEIPGTVNGEDVILRHSCDNPACVNPNHLSMGTRRQNTADSVARGRHRSRFNPEQILEIRESFSNSDIAIEDLAKSYGATTYEMSNILSNFRYKNTNYVVPSKIENKTNIFSTKESFQDFKRRMFEKLKDEQFLKKSQEYIRKTTIIEDECWIWKGPVHGKYGKNTYGNVRMQANRFSYIVFKGLIPEHNDSGEKIFACHTCDNPLCVNPEHLYLGTAKDNANDTTSRGRRPIGSKHSKAKFSDEQVKDIRNFYNKFNVSVAFLSKFYKVDAHTIRSMINNTSYNDKDFIPIEKNSANSRIMCVHATTESNKGDK
mgnify:CR=1 FL=1